MNKDMCVVCDDGFLNIRAGAIIMKDGELLMVSNDRDYLYSVGGRLKFGETAEEAVVREVLEPRLMGKEMGLKPLYVLLSVYVGLKLFGVGGIVLGPIGLTILKTVFEQTSFSHTT